MGMASLWSETPLQDIHIMLHPHLHPQCLKSLEPFASEHKAAPISMPRLVLLGHISQICLCIIARLPTTVDPIRPQRPILAALIPRSPLCLPFPHATLL